MGYGDRVGAGWRFGGPLTRAVRWLLIANVAAFVAQIVVHLAVPDGLERVGVWLGLSPKLAIGKLRLWQFVTYGFLHQVVTVLPFHIASNLFLLWLFGCDVERELGTGRFLRLYFGALVAAGLCMLPMYWTSVWGASGAVFGVMAIYARLFGGRVLLLMGLIPMRARTLVFILVGLEVLYLLSTGGRSPVAHLAHLGGFALGWFFLPLERAVEGRRDARRFRRAQQSAREEAEIRVRVDRLLAKVAREGPGSLSRRERDFLSRASRMFRK